MTDHQYYLHVGPAGYSRPGGIQHHPGQCRTVGKTLALELGDHGFTVNNILPGYSATNRLQDLAESKARGKGVSPADIQESWTVNTSLRRLEKPGEIASASAFLA